MCFAQYVHVLAAGVNDASACLRCGMMERCQRVCGSRCLITAPYTLFLGQRQACSCVLAGSLVERVCRMQFLLQLACWMYHTCSRLRACGGCVIKKHCMLDVRCSCQPLPQRQGPRHNKGTAAVGVRLSCVPKRGLLTICLRGVSGGGFSFRGCEQGGCSVARVGITGTTIS
jgi:hypothetical protein